LLSLTTKTQELLRFAGYRGAEYQRPFTKVVKDSFDKCRMGSMIALVDSARLTPSFGGKTCEYALTPSAVPHTTREHG
jgi:hypothetical protein